MAVFNDRVFLADTLPRVSRDRALALSRSQKYTRHNQRRFTARLARSSILSANESPGDFKLKVLQQIEEDIDGGAIEEVRVLLTTNFLIYSSMHRRWDRIRSMVIQRSKNIIIFHLQGKMPINLIPVYYHASSILNYGFDQASISDAPVWYQDTSPSLRYWLMSRWVQVDLALVDTYFDCEWNESIEIFRYQVGIHEYGTTLMRTHPMTQEHKCRTGPETMRTVSIKLTASWFKLVTFEIRDFEKVRRVEQV